MENLKNCYSGYGDLPTQHRIEREGRKYIESEYPLLDKFLRCTVHEGGDDLKADKTRAADESSGGRRMNVQGEISSLQKERLGSHPSGGKSAYQDHHQKMQSLQETDVVALIAAGAVVVLAVISIFVVNTSKKKEAKRS